MKEESGKLGMRMRLIAIVAAAMVALGSLIGCDGSTVIRVDENIGVTDSPETSSSPVIRVVENVGVSDLPQARSSAAISIVENIGVSDLPRVYPSAVIRVVENIGVTDSPTLTPQQAPVQTPKPLPAQPLPPPKLTSPGASSSPGPIISLLTPNLQWSGVPGADYYGLYIVDIATKSIVFNSQAKKINITGTAYTLPSGVLVWGKSYYWYMNSHNSAGWGSNSAFLYFQTQTPKQ